MTGRPGLVGIHHIQVAAPRGSEDVLRRFYGDVLGMTEVPKPPDLVGRGGVWFRAGGVEQIQFGDEPVEVVELLVEAFHLTAPLVYRRSIARTLSSRR